MDLIITAFCLMLRIIAIFLTVACGIGAFMTIFIGMMTFWDWLEERFF